MEVIIKRKLKQIAKLTSKYNSCLAELHAMKTKLAEIKKENSCPICLFPWEAQGDHRLVALRCGHVFGEKCIRQVLSQKSECPNCRKKMRIRDLHYIFGCSILPSPPQ